MRTQPKPQVEKPSHDSKAHKGIQRLCPRRFLPEEQYTSSKMPTGAGGSVILSIPNKSPSIFQPWATGGGTSG
ncbi:hypothetical protein R3I94_008811 [Phoxinus phoxinus]